MVLGTWFPVTSFIFQFISGKLKSPRRRTWRGTNYIEI
jgi:hypothetical protein